MLSPGARQKRDADRRRRGPGRRRGRRRRPRLGQHAARRPHAAGLRRRGRRGGEAAASKGRGARKVDATGSSTRSSSPSWAAAASSASAWARPRRRGWSSSPTPRAKPVAHLALVGKGVTFDSGGLTIKPAASMNEMKSDMAGAAAVVQATLAIARLELPVKVSTFVPMAENMVSGSAIRPGDVLTMYGGTTVEVLNTDAEGRLILGDALVRATEVEARRDPRRRHPDRPHGRRARRQGRRRDGLRRRRRRPCSPRPRRPARRTGRCRSPRRWTSASTAARSPTCPSTTGSAGAAACSRRRSCASSPPACRGRTSTSPARPATPAGPSGHLTFGGTGFAVATLVDYARALTS